MGLRIDGPACPFLTILYLLIGNGELSTGLRIVSDKKRYGKTSGIQGEILPTSSYQSGRSSKVCEVWQSDRGFEAWTLSRVQEDSRQMGVGISTPASFTKDQS
jgi:hypothetical protein